MSENPDRGCVFHLFCNSGFMAASLSREELRRVLDLRVECGISDGGAIMPIIGLLEGAYIV